MATSDKDPSSQMVDIDWDAPELRDLLKRTESLQLDQRGAFEARAVLLRRAWSDSAPALDATLVAEHGGGGVVLLTAYPLEPGEPVMVDLNPRLHSGSGRGLFEVESCHHGKRAEERDRRVWVALLRSAGSHLAGI